MKPFYRMCMGIVGPLSSKACMVKTRSVKFTFVTLTVFLLKYCVNAKSVAKGPKIISTVFSVTCTLSWILGN